MYQNTTTTPQTILPITTKSNKFAHGAGVCMKISHQTLFVLLNSLYLVNMHITLLSREHPFYGVNVNLKLAHTFFFPNYPFN